MLIQCTGGQPELQRRTHAFTQSAGADGLLTVSFSMDAKNFGIRSDVASHAPCLSVAA